MYQQMDVFPEFWLFRMLSEYYNSWKWFTGLFSLINFFPVWTVQNNGFLFWVLIYFLIIYAL